MDLSSRRVNKQNWPGCLFLNYGEKNLEPKIQNGCSENELFNGLTCNDAQYMVSELILVKEYIYGVFIMI